MFLFDVKSLFMNMSLTEKVTDRILERIYDPKEINTQIACPEMKVLLTWCTKNVHFTFDNRIYEQNDGVGMGSPLGPVLGCIFLVKLDQI